MQLFALQRAAITALSTEIPTVAKSKQSRTEKLD